MNHETLQALYALDVAEVGEEEAAKRWEFGDGNDWYQCHKTPEWSRDRVYRRKPGIPWPKVLLEQPISAWPADAPEWANYIVTSQYGTKLAFECKPTVQESGKCWVAHKGTGSNILACPNWRDSLIERPKPVEQKIDWSKLHNSVERFWGETDAFPSHWIAWNCDEHTRGNPLPDGLVVEWYGTDNLLRGYLRIDWDDVTRFRIVGIQEGWE